MKSLVVLVKFQLAITSFTQLTQSQSQSQSVTDSGVSDSALGEQGVPGDLMMAAAAEAGTSEGSVNAAGLSAKRGDGDNQPVDSWAQVTGRTHASLFSGTASDHVTQIRPIFLAYNRVTIEGHCIPISDIVFALAHAVGDANQIDGVQAMHSGWNIYMKTEQDRAQLLMTGINLAGRHVSLSVFRRDQGNMVKIIVKDLPLHEVLNSIVLSELKLHAKVSSDVKYCNVFVNGKRTHMQNGDRFAYVTQEEILKIPDDLFVQGFKARIFKPPKFQKCH